MACDNILWTDEAISMMMLVTIFVNFYAIKVSVYSHENFIL